MTNWYETSFRYSKGTLSVTALPAGEPLQVSAVLQNSGVRDGYETVELFLIPKKNPDAPRCSLAGIAKVHLRAGEAQTIHLTIDPRQLSLVDASGVRSVQPDDYEIYLGGSQPSPHSGIYLPFRIVG
jgi:beta-glucosidase